MKIFFFILASFFININCLSIQFGNPSLTIFKNKTELGIYGKSISNRSVSIIGESCITSFLGLFSYGDASADLAQQQAHIKEIYTINQSVKTQYFFIQEYCTKVTGI